MRRFCWLYWERSCTSRPYGRVASSVYWVLLPHLRIYAEAALNIKSWYTYLYMITLFCMASLLNNRWNAFIAFVLPAELKLTQMLVHHSWFMTVEADQGSHFQETVRLYVINNICSMRRFVYKRNYDFFFLLVGWHLAQSFSGER